MKKNLKLLFILSFFLLVISSNKVFSTSKEEILTLEILLKSVERSYPSLLAALLEKNVAEGKILASYGKYDLKTKVGVISEPTGYYSPNRRYFGMLEQPTTLWGTTFFGGWERGTGIFEPYYGDKETLSNGELTLGMRIPLLKDGQIDQNRTTLAQAKIDSLLADALFEQEKLMITRAATRRYWDWVAAGKRLNITRNLLEIAERRKIDVQELVQHGDFPKIENIEIQRIILERKNQFIAAKRMLENTAIELSLYYRKKNGDPIIPEEKNLPREFPSAVIWSEKKMQEDSLTAITKRPEKKYLSWQKDQAHLELKLQQNRLLPNLDFNLAASRDFGEGNKKLEGTDINIGLQMEIPLQRREAEGKIEIEEAKIQQLEQKIRLTEDRIKADVVDAYLAVKAAYERLVLAHEELSLAKQMEEAERTKFKLGDTTQFTVNLRELQTADAAIREVIAQQEYHRSIADYRAAVGLSIIDPL